MGGSQEGRGEPPWSWTRFCMGLFHVLEAVTQPHHRGPHGSLTAATRTDVSTMDSRGGPAADSAVTCLE